MGELKDYQISQEVTLDLVRTDAPQLAMVKQYDNQVRVLRVNLVANGLAYEIPEGFVVRLRGTRSDGKGIMSDAIATEGNTAWFEITNAMTACAGRIPCDVELSNADGAVVKTASLWLDVKWSPLQDGTVQASETYQSLEAALAKAHVNIKSVEQTVTSLEDSGENQITVKLTNGESSVFSVRNGSTGSEGAVGKSAYEYAKEAGYAGSEEDFAKTLGGEMTIQDETVSEEKLTQTVRDRLNPLASTVTAYEAGDVKAIKRNDMIHDHIIPMMNTKYFNTRNTIPIEPETTDNGNNVIHESTIIAVDNMIGMVVYLENMTGNTTDTAIKGGDTRIRGRYLFYRYGVLNCNSPAIGDAFDIMYPGVELSDGTTAVGGFGTCTAFCCNNRVYVLAQGYDANSASRFFISYGDVVSSSDYWSVSAIPEIVWSAPQPMMLTADGETVEYTASALAAACGLDSAIIQNNNQVWVSGTTFYMAVNIRSQGAAVLTSTDGVTWAYKGFFTSKYKCRFINESACAYRDSNRLWIASRNSYASSTTTDDKSNKNFLTLLKINTRTWEKVDEYNIPDCGCKPFFIPSSTCPVNGVKALLLMHNPYTRNAAEILAIGDYPMYSIGEIRTGANYITACSSLSAGQIKYVMTCGTNGLVTDRKGALVHCAIAISDRVYDHMMPINEYLNGCGTSWYSITNTLTNVSTNNPTAKVKGGMQYTAVLTPDDGYTLDSVTVKMNGVDVTSTFYSSGVVAIGNVTGAITITATAAMVSSE